MAAIYPIDYPFNVDDEGWPEAVYAPPYPFEHYYDNGRNPRQIQPTSEFKNGYHHRSDANYTLPLAIRRHTPGSMDPNLSQTSSRSLSPTINPRFTVKRNLSQTNHRSVSVRNHSSTSQDPDERPIKPMKDTSVYHQSSSQQKTFQPKKSSLRTPKPIQSSPRYEPESFPSPQPPPSHTSMDIALGRRPVRTDLIPKTPFGIPPQRNRSRRTILKQYDDDDYYPVTYVTPVPKKIVSYREVSGMTTRELENYHMSKPRRVVRVRSPPVERIFYRT